MCITLFRKQIITFHVITQLFAIFYVGLYSLLSSLLQEPSLGPSNSPNSQEWDQAQFRPVERFRTRCRFDRGWAREFVPCPDPVFFARVGNVHCSRRESCTQVRQQRKWSERAGRRSLFSQNSETTGGDVSSFEKDIFRLPPPTPSRSSRRSTNIEASSPYSHAYLHGMKSFYAGNTPRQQRHASFLFFLSFSSRL